MKYLSIILVIVLVIIIAIFITSKIETEKNIGLPNPASVNCQEKGGQLEIKELSQGQIGFCLFEDGSQCEEWDLYNNRCESGQLKIEILQSGTGDLAEKGNTLIVHYTGSLENGEKFDSSFERNQPLSFVLGTGEVIQGWEQGILGMKIGEKRKLTIAPELAYGDFGIENVIPPSATLIFEVELLEIK